MADSVTCLTFCEDEATQLPDSQAGFHLDSLDTVTELLPKPAESGTARHQHSVAKNRQVSPRHTDAASFPPPDSPRREPRERRLTSGSPPEARVLSTVPTRSHLMSVRRRVSLTIHAGNRAAVVISSASRQK